MIHKKKRAYVMRPYCAFVVCPGCGTTFTTIQEHGLKIAYVQCPHCEAVFDCRTHQLRDK